MFGGTIKVTPFGAVVLLATALVSFTIYFKSGTDRQSSERVNLRVLLAEGLAAAVEAGNEIRRLRESNPLKPVAKGETEEGAKELLTDADVRSHALIARRLRATFPNVKLISEEHDTLPKDLEPLAQENIFLSDLKTLSVVEEKVSDVTLWVDPLDATQEFTENLLEFVTVMVCVAVKGLPVIGIIDQPFEKQKDKRTVWGWVGHGTSTNLQHSKRQTSSSYRTIIVSRSHAGDVKQVAQKAFGNNTKIVPAGGAGYKTLQVISGEANAYVHVTAIKKWDICAPNAIIKSVGGQMTTLEGNLIDYESTISRTKNGIVAAMENHEEYIKQLRDLTV